MRLRIVAALVTAASALAVAPAATAAAPGAGTYTRITAPGSIIYKYDSAHPNANTLKITGVASADVTSVDIECIYLTDADPHVSSIAVNVAVTSGRFATVATLTDFVSTCRLRAVPSAAQPGSYLGSYSGPILRSNTFKAASDGGIVDAYSVITEEGDGVAAVLDAGSCGATLMLTLDLPSVTVHGTPALNCAFALMPSNVTSTVATGSTIKVDGHNAYLPSGVASYLNSNLSLGLQQTRLTTTFTRSSTGDLTVTESATLVRCSVADTYPPTTTSCPALVSTGVVFKRTVDVFRGAHQVRMRDSFSSPGAAHQVSAQYVGQTTPPATGASGYVFPGHGASFVGVSNRQSVTGLGTKAGTVLVRSDRFAASDEPAADTRALSWSKAPSKIQFGASTVAFGMSYALAVPAHGAVYLGFATSQSPTTAGAAALAAVATHEMVATPVVASPGAGKTVKGKTLVLTGSVARGANGLPKSVSVNGHAAKVTANSAGTAVGWKVVLTAPYGLHRLAIVATDIVGNTASKTVSIRNKP